MIEVEGLEKTYFAGSVATPVLKGVSFRIDEGEYVAIMGTSGTGKSTLMNILGCLDKPTAGRYLLDGTDVVSLDDDALSGLRNEKIGFVFQQFHLLERATAMRSVMLPLIYADDYPENAEERAEKALAAVGLADRRQYRPNELSGGQQQRVAIARALITDPEIILADEPTGALDRKSGLEIMAIFKKLHRQGRTIILVTHDRALAENAQRIIVLEDGKIATDGAVEKQRDPDLELDTLGAGEDKK
ncbi:MAG: ABC transporter ATP-binding protein [Deltaproteobacteria bacterium]|nr:ABC transporter ATP-binding protein [Deltaproteobacteria bacterium]